MRILTPDELSVAYYALGRCSGAEKRAFLNSVTVILQFEHWFDIQCFLRECSYDFILKVWALEQLFVQAKDSPNYLMKVYGATLRGDVKKRAATLLLEHFGEEDKAVAKDFAPAEIVTIANFLQQRGLLADK